MSNDRAVPLLPTKPSELRSLLDLEDHRRAGGRQSRTDVPARGMLDVLRAFTTTLRRHRVRHALCDTLALAFYARPRATQSLAFVCCAEQHDTVLQALGQTGFVLRQAEPARLTFVDPLSGIEVILRLGAVDPEKSASTDPLEADCLGIPIPLIRPEYLLWICCRDSRMQDRADAVALLKGKQVNLPWLQAQISAALDERAGPQLSILQLCAEHDADADADADAGDYSASVKRRLATRTDERLPMPVFRITRFDNL